MVVVVVVVAVFLDVAMEVVVVLICKAAMLALPPSLFSFTGDRAVDFARCLPSAYAFSSTASTSVFATNTVSLKGLLTSPGADVTSSSITAKSSFYQSQA